MFYSNSAFDIFSRVQCMGVTRTVVFIYLAIVIVLSPCLLQRKG